VNLRAECGVERMCVGVVVVGGPLDAAAPLFASDRAECSHERRADALALAGLPDVELLEIERVREADGWPEVGVRGHAHHFVAVSGEQHVRRHGVAEQHRRTVQLASTVSPLRQPEGADTGSRADGGDVRLRRRAGAPESAGTAVGPGIDSIVSASRIRTASSTSETLATRARPSTLIGSRYGTRAGFAVGNHAAFSGTQGATRAPGPRREPALPATATAGGRVGSSAVPEIDYLLLCDYVRADGGLVHIMAGGIDRIRAPRLPTAHPLGVAARIAFDSGEAGTEHELQLRFLDPTGEPKGDIRGQFRLSQQAENVPPGWPLGGVFAVNFVVPVQAYGIHTLELAVDGQPLKSVKVIVEPPPEA
jgi:hypothetical protein